MDLAVEEIQELLTSMSKQIDSIRDELLHMTWYMRGGVSYTEVMMLSSKERDIISKIIKENIETTKKTQIPFF